MKRTSDHQLTKDNAEAADASTDQPHAFERAPPEVMAKRRIVKARRTQNLRPPTHNPGPSPFATLAKPAPTAPPAVVDKHPEKVEKPAETPEKPVEEVQKPAALGKGTEPTDTPAEPDKPADIAEATDDQPTTTPTKTPADPAAPPAAESPPPSGNTNEAAPTTAETDTAPSSTTANPSTSAPTATNTEAPAPKPALAATDPTPAPLKPATPANGTAKPIIFGSATQPVSFAAAAKTDAFNFKAAEPAPKVEEKKPEFKEAKVLTGEENDKELFRTRVKLYTLERAENGSSWKERGVGSLKLNKNTETEKPRLLMRTEATLRVVLNTPVFKGFKIDRAADKSIRFQGFSVDDEKKTTSFLARFTTKDIASDMIAAIEKCKDELE